MNQNQYNFEDPGEVLVLLLRHRKNLQYLNQINSWRDKIATYLLEIENLEQLKKPYDSEIKDLMRMRDRGFLDRIGYREMLEEFQPKQLEFQRKISKLTNDCSLLESKITNYQNAIRPSQDFLHYFESTVAKYSIVRISLKEELLEYLLVPDSIRQVYVQSTRNLLAVNSDLGAVLINHNVGRVQSEDYRFKDLEIVSTQIADDETLRLLEGLYHSTQQSNPFRIKDRHLGGGDIQRWRDARVNELVKCNRCFTLYPMGSTCNCFT